MKAQTSVQLLSVLCLCLVSVHAPPGDGAFKNIIEDIVNSTVGTGGGVIGDLIGGAGGSGGVASGFLQAVTSNLFSKCGNGNLENICTPQQMKNGIDQTVAEMKANDPNGGLPPIGAVISALDARNWICNACNPCDPKAECHSTDCSATCSCPVSLGWSGEGFVSDPCFTVCGDGIIAGEEVCDDGNTWLRDGCSPQCQWETNPGHGRFSYDCSTGSPTACQKIRVPRERGERDSRRSERDGIFGRINGESTDRKSFRERRQQ
eukprot:Filipodium_phascolosomae@DN1224_c0_g1_i1.p1